MFKCLVFKEKSDREGLLCVDKELVDPLLLQLLFREVVANAHLLDC